MYEEAYTFTGLLGRKSRLMTASGYSSTRDRRSPQRSAVAANVTIIHNTVSHHLTVDLKSSVASSAIRARNTSLVTNMSATVRPRLAARQTRWAIMMTTWLGAVVWVTAIVDFHRAKHSHVANGILVGLMSHVRICFGKDVNSPCTSRTSRTVILVVSTWKPTARGALAHASCLPIVFVRNSLLYSIVRLRGPCESSQNHRYLPMAASWFHVRRELPKP
nr:hypothetical protein CFP56_79191 [Quercus suber]